MLAVRDEASEARALALVEARALLPEINAAGARALERQFDGAANEARAHVMVKHLMADRPCGGWRRVPERERERLLHLLLRLLRLLLLRVIRHRGEA